MPNNATALKMKDFSSGLSFNAQGLKSETIMFTESEFLNTRLTIWNISKELECFSKSQMIKNNKNFLKKGSLLLK